MAKPDCESDAKVVRDSASARFRAVRGAGALEGRLTIEEGVDLTRPIAAQVLKEKRRRSEADPAKR
ncbi:MAG TPA: hypothetical protein VF759_06305 [Allosphingosinicella sp.]